MTPIIDYIEYIPYLLLLVACGHDFHPTPHIFVNDDKIHPESIAHVIKCVLSLT
jgi:hypothetical protein